MITIPVDARVYVYPVSKKTERGDDYIHQSDTVVVMFDYSGVLPDSEFEVKFDNCRFWKVQIVEHISGTFIGVCLPDFSKTDGQLIGTMDIQRVEGNRFF